MAASRRCSGYVICVIILVAANIGWWQMTSRPASASSTSGSTVTISQSLPSEELKIHSQLVQVPQVDFTVFGQEFQPDPYLPLFGNDALEARKSSRIIPDYKKVRNSYRIPSILNPRGFDCRALLDGNVAEHRRAQEYMKKNVKIAVIEEKYMDMLRDCEKFKSQRGYVLVPPSAEEENYPLAFSITVSRNIEQVERLLRAIYQPQNLYCIHVDLNLPLRLHQTVHALASCFENVFIPTTLSETIPSDVSDLLPTYNCMKDLALFHKGKWNYFINLEEKEVPLRTNWELVQIAKILNGVNDLGGSKQRIDIKRVNFIWKSRFSKSRAEIFHFNTLKLRTDPLPLDFSFYKGDIYGMFSHGMVQYLIHSPVAQSFVTWCKDAGYPAEFFWNTLNYNPHLRAPGGYSGPDDVAHEYSYHQISRVKQWIGINYNKRACLGQELNEICLFGLGDVPWLNTRPEIAVHKMNLTSQYLAYDCLEESHRNRTILGDEVPFDRHLYSKLPVVKYGRNDGL